MAKSIGENLKPFTGNGDAPDEWKIPPITLQTTKLGGRGVQALKGHAVHGFFIAIYSAQIKKVILWHVSYKWFTLILMTYIVNWRHCTWCTFKV